MYEVIYLARMCANQGEEFLVCGKLRLRTNPVNTRRTFNVYKMPM